jgi:hypothetical protein
VERGEDGGGGDEGDNGGGGGGGRDGYIKPLQINPLQILAVSIPKRPRNGCFNSETAVRLFQF